jgi:hypothetical protein
VIIAACAWLNVPVTELIAKATICHCPGARPPALAIVNPLFRNCGPNSAATSGRGPNAGTPRKTGEPPACGYAHT